MADNARFLGVDALRGIAALMVCVCHIAAAPVVLEPTLLGSFPGIADYGRHGVTVFFVLSGFVIAHSTYNGAHSLRYFGRFAARRFVRLDIPYWFAILLECSLLLISGFVLAAYTRELPSFAQVSANAFYLQGLLGYADIVPVFWTLAYEVQFYLVLVGGLVVRRWLSHRLAPGLLRRVVLGGVALSFFVSLAIFVPLSPASPPGLFVDRWFMFLLGVIAYLHYRGDLTSSWLIVANLLLVAASLATLGSGADIVLCVAGFTSVLLLAIAKQQVWVSWLAARPLLFFGRISYGLYLLHLCVGWRAAVLFRELAGAAYSTELAIVGFIIGMLVSILAAYILHVLLEKPAINLARLIRLPRRAEAR